MRKHYRVGLRNGQDFRFFGTAAEVSEFFSSDQIIYIHEIV